MNNFFSFEQQPRIRKSLVDEIRFDTDRMQIHFYLNEETVNSEKHIIWYFYDENRSRADNKKTMCLAWNTIEQQDKDET